MMNQYFKGVFSAFLGASLMNGIVSEWQIDQIKEFISHYNEAMIDHLQLSAHEKVQQKCQMKQSLEAYIQGIKDLLAGEGRLVRG